jgi:hypothetical protein
MFRSANDRPIIVIVTKVERLVWTDRLSAPPTHGVTTRDLGGGPAPGPAVGGVVSSGCC